MLAMQTSYMDPWIRMEFPPSSKLLSGLLKLGLEEVINPVKRPLVCSEMTSIPTSVMCEIFLSITGVKLRSRGTATCLFC